MRESPSAHAAVGNRFPGAYQGRSSMDGGAPTREITRETGRKAGQARKSSQPATSGSELSRRCRGSMGFRAGLAASHHERRAGARSEQIEMPQLHDLGARGCGVAGLRECRCGRCGRRRRATGATNRQPYKGRKASNSDHGVLLARLERARDCLEQQAGHRPSTAESGENGARGCALYRQISGRVERAAPPLDPPRATSNHRLLCADGGRRSFV